MSMVRERAWRSMPNFLTVAGTFGLLLDFAAAPYTGFAADIRARPSPASRVAVFEAADTTREAVGANRDLGAATSAIEQARARLQQAGLWPNPSLQLSGAHDGAFSNEGEYDASAGFEQRFPIAGRLARSQDVARVDVAMALAEVRDATRRLVGEVKRLSTICSFCRSRSPRAMS